MALIWKQLDCVLALLGASILLLVLLPSVNGNSNSSDGPTPRHTLFFDDPKIKELSSGSHNYNCRFYSNDKTGEGKSSEKMDVANGYTREFCGCTKSGGGKSAGFQFPPVNFTCLTSFYKVAFMPMCGNEWYDQMKMCSLVHFFDDKPDIKSAKNDVQKKTLILLDGCATCKGNAKITGFKVTHSEEAGGFFSNDCSAEEEFVAMEQSGLDIGLSAGTDVSEKTTGFTLPVVLYHRICDNVFSKTTPPEEYKNVKLHVTHSCGGASKTSVIDLPIIELGKGHFEKNNVAELRGLWLHLDGNNIPKQQYRTAGDYSEPPKYEKADALQWEDAHVECWTNGNQCDWLMNN